jgi:hypothetical protein
MATHPIYKWIRLPQLLGLVGLAVCALPVVGSPSPREALFLFQRCAGLYYALSQYTEAVEGETGQELQQQLLADARAAETAAVHFRARLQEERQPELDYSGELYADWQASVHDNALTIANQTYRILSRSGVAVIAQDLVPCNELHPLQSAIVRGEPG